MKQMQLNIDRRKFLKLSGITGAGLMLGLSTKANGITSIVSITDASSSFELTPFVMIENTGVITIFNPNTIIDKGTFENGPAFSAGIEYVIVNGVFALKNGKTVENVFAGQPVYGKFKK